MTLTTQINSSSPSATGNVTRKFEEQQVVITHAHLEEFMIAPLQDGWERHEMMVDLLEAIARSSFHTVLNVNGAIDRDMSIQILQAIRHNKPVVFCQLPDFTDTVSTYSQRLIASLLHSFIIADLPHMNGAQINHLLRRIKTQVNYGIDMRDEVLIRSHISGYLRDLPRQNMATAARISPQAA